jgi:hypothetical protein
MTTYTIEPRVKERWFKDNEMYYDLVKHSIVYYWSDPSYGNGGADFREIKIEKTVFFSKNIEEVLAIKNNLILTKTNKYEN